MKKVMYVGERFGGYGKVFQMFRDRRGLEYRFSGIKGLYFGSIYRLEKGERMKREPASIEVADWEPTKEERAEFEAQKIVITAYRRQRRKVMEIRRPHDDILRAVQLLAPFYRALDHFDRQSFIAWINNACVKEALAKPNRRRKK